MFAKNTAAARARPSPDEIARVAYEFYEARGRRDGRDIDDWLSAEQLLTPSSVAQHQPVHMGKGSI
jgi:hypothetical protein